MSQRVHLLESKAYVAGGNTQVSLRDLPAGHRIKSLILRLEAIITQAAGAPAIDGDHLQTIFQNVELGKRIKGTGRYFDLLNWMMNGVQPGQPADVPAAGAGAYRRNISCVIPFADLDAQFPTDAAPRSEWFRDTPIIVDFLNVTSSWNANTSATGTLRAFAIIEPIDANETPSAVQLGYTDWSGQQPQLEPSLYTHAFLMKDNATLATANTITSAEVASVSVSIDGQRIVDLAKAEELAFLQDLYKGEGGSLRALSATVPVAGEGLTDEPAFTVGAAATVTMEYVPVLVTQRGYKLSNAYEANRGVRIDFTGTLTTFRIGWRRVEARSADQALRAIEKVGETPNPQAIRAKTGSKKPLSPMKAGLLRYLPLKQD